MMLQKKLGDTNRNAVLVDSYLGAKPLLTTPFPSRGNIIRFHASDGFGVLQFADSPGLLPASNVRTAAFPFPKSVLSSWWSHYYSLCGQTCCPTSRTASHENSRVLPGKFSATKAICRQGCCDVFLLSVAVSRPVLCCLVAVNAPLLLVCILRHNNSGTNTNVQKPCPPYPFWALHVLLLV